MADDDCAKTKRKSSLLDMGTKNNIDKRRRNTRDWGELDVDVLQQILSCLSFMDILQAKAVCRHWCSVTKSIIQSCMSPQHVVPLLLIPPQEEDEEGDDKKATSCCFLVSPEGRRAYNREENMPKEICIGCCIGSSHGWMIFLDEKIAPYLLNPLTGARIEFPRIDSFLGIERIARDINGYGSAEFIVDYVTDWGRCSTSTKLLQRLIPKAILVSNSKEDNNFAMVLICSQNKMLAFCNHKDNFWTDLSCKHGPYVDIMSHNNQLYALNKYGSVVEVWEIGSSPHPAKKMTIELPSPRRSLLVSQYYGDLCNYTLYLTESRGNILLVFRFIGELVDGDGRLLREADLLTDESTHPLVCPYKTILFHLYKLDIKNKQWLGVESLHDQVLFLGGNHSISISSRDLAGSKGNSVYFIDDYWMRMEEDYLYGGHDMGIFDLEDESVEPFYEPVAMRIQPPPCWILPYPF